VTLDSQLQKATSDYRKIETDLTTTVEARQRLDVQLTENEQVQKELALLTPENEVFKLIGPVLVKQDQAEAKSNVDKRLEFIRNEIKRREDQLKELTSRQEKKRVEIVQLQSQQQAQLQGGPQSGQLPGS